MIFYIYNYKVPRRWNTESHSIFAITTCTKCACSFSPVILFLVFLHKTLSANTISHARHCLDIHMWPFIASALLGLALACYTPTQHTLRFSNVLCICLFHNWFNYVIKQWFKKLDFLKLWQLYMTCLCIHKETWLGMCFVSRFFTYEILNFYLSSQVYCNCLTISALLPCCFPNALFWSMLVGQNANLFTVIVSLNACYKLLSFIFYSLTL